MIQQETIAGSPQTLGKQAELFQLVTHLLRTELQPLPAIPQNSIDLMGDLSHQKPSLVGVAKVECRANRESSQVVQTFCHLLLRIGREQRDKLFL